MKNKKKKSKKKLFTSCHWESLVQSICDQRVRRMMPKAIIFGRFTFELFKADAEKLGNVEMTNTLIWGMTYKVDKTKDYFLHLECEYEGK